MSAKYTCPECGGEFDEPADVTAKTLRPGVRIVKYDAKGCPWCQHPMSGTGENPRKSGLFE